MKECGNLGAKLVLSSNQTDGILKADTGSATFLSRRKITLLVSKQDQIIG
jgi:hypothetical protein